MSIPPRAGRDLLVPVSLIPSLRRIAHRLETDEALSLALEEAGREAGARIFPLLQADAGTTGVEAFWDRLTRVLKARGWGTVTHRPVHPGISLLECPDTVEAETSHGGEDPLPGCPLTTGFLSGLLSEAAGRRVELLQVSCRGEGADLCRWAFGAAPALERLKQHLESGEPLEAGLAFP